MLLATHVAAQNDEPKSCRLCLRAQTFAFSRRRRQSAAMRCYAALDCFDFAPIQIFHKSTFPKSYRDSSLKFAWYVTLYCVSPGAIGDTASGICRQARAHPRFEKREIRGRHRREFCTDARRPEDGRPVVVEIGECPLHDDLPRFDDNQTRARPSISH